MKSIFTKLQKLYNFLFTKANFFVYNLKQVFLFLGGGLATLLLFKFDYKKYPPPVTQQPQIVEAVPGNSMIVESFHLARIDARNQKLELVKIASAKCETRIVKGLQDFCRFHGRVPTNAELDFIVNAQVEYCLDNDFYFLIQDGFVFELTCQNMKSYAVYVLKNSQIKLGGGFMGTSSITANALSKSSTSVAGVNYRPFIAPRTPVNPVSRVPSVSTLKAYTRANRNQSLPLLNLSQKDISQESSKNKKNPTNKKASISSTQSSKKQENNYRNQDTLISRTKDRLQDLGIEITEVQTQRSINFATFGQSRAVYRQIMQFPDCSAKLIYIGEEGSGNVSSPFTRVDLHLRLMGQGSHVNKLFRVGFEEGGKVTNYEMVAAFPLNTPKERIFVAEGQVIKAEVLLAEADPTRLVTNVYKNPGKKLSPEQVRRWIRQSKETARKLTQTKSTKTTLEKLKPSDKELAVFKKIQRGGGGEPRHENRTIRRKK